VGLGLQSGVARRFIVEQQRGTGTLHAVVLSKIVDGQVAKWCKSVSGAGLAAWCGQAVVVILKAQGCSACCLAGEYFRRQSGQVVQRREYAFWLMYRK
jgi:hypothetical protein